MSTKTATRQGETYNRAAKAAKFAEHFLDADLRNLDAADWALAATLLDIKPASAATKAMTQAILDVLADDTARRAVGTGPEQIAYNTGRRAALAAQAFALLGMDPTEAEIGQWQAVKVASEQTRDAAFALYPFIAGVVA